ncbi:MAG: hypothetical protein KBS51_03890 [Lachnospiraceae bacterium]|nr:hypothetical protein [Candidatus Darwinimomas equi]
MIFTDYIPCMGCDNIETFGAVCVKCGKCGRRFDEYGNCININDYPAYDYNEDEE